MPCLKLKDVHRRRVCRPQKLWLVSTSSTASLLKELDAITDDCRAVLLYYCERTATSGVHSVVLNRASLTFNDIDSCGEGRAIIHTHPKLTTDKSSDSTNSDGVQFEDGWLYIDSPSPNWSGSALSFYPTNMCAQPLQLAGALIKLKAPKETCMAIIPMGTANDFATAAGIPEDPWEALELAVTDTAYPIDVGMVNNQVNSSPQKHQAIIDLPRLSGADFSNVS